MKYLGKAEPITEEKGPKPNELLIAEAKKNQDVKRWAPVLAKMPEVTSQKYGMMAALLENQHKAMSGKGSSLLFEDAFQTGNIADFTRFALPLIRKAYPKLISDNLIGVQPMSQPASLIFYIRYRYGISKGQTVAGTQIMRQNTSAQFARQNGWALDPYYSSQTVGGQGWDGEDLTNNGGNVIGTLIHKPVLAGTVIVNFYSAASLDNGCEGNPEPEIQVSFNATGGIELAAVKNPTVYVVDTNPSNTFFNYATGQVKVTFTTGSVASLTPRASYEYDLENNPFQPEVTMSIDSDSMSALTRKLKTSWSLEAAQDLKSVHNIDAEATLTDLMADEMVAEIDREIINDLIIASAIRATHNFATAAGASVNFTDRNIALLYKTIEVANIIHRTTLRGPANWLVTSADIASKYEQLNDFRGSDALVEDGIDIGITNAGTIQGKLKLYKDPLFPNCKVLMGFKGGNVMDTGYVYGPYIPLLSTPTVMDPNSFTPNKGIMTRYGKKLVEDGGLYYGVITVSNL
jgi:hypothetical protein